MSTSVRSLTKDEVVSRFINDMAKKKRVARMNEADCYNWEKGRGIGTRVAKHRQRQPNWRAK